MAENKNAEQTKIDANQQEKLKEKVAVQNKDDQIKQMSSQELRKELSKKNADYIFRLQKELETQGKMSQEEAQKRIDLLLPEIVLAQHHGRPASNFYTMSPKLKAADLIKPKEKTAADIPFWQYAVDGALIYVVLFVGIFGVLALFQTNSKANAQMGILTLISVGAGMGALMTKYNELILPATGKSNKIPWSKLILGLVTMILGLLALMWLLSLPALKVINPILPGEANIIIAIAVDGIRWLFRKHYELIGSVFSPVARNK